MLKRIRYIIWACLLVGLIREPPARSQSVISAPDGTGTIVTPRGNRLDISGGQLSRDGSNLFHSFTQLGLTQDQTANFLSSPKIQNILSRVTGGNVSVIDGLLQVSGGSSNLFLMNPAGIVFGTHASLNLPGSFTATTSNGIQFGSNWFNAYSANNYSSLVGNPGTFAFTMPQPGGIINTGNLTVSPGQALTLIGGTVISTGQLTAPQGQILVTAVPGGNWVRISPPGQTISLEIHPPTSSTNQPNTWLIPIASLPELLTSGGESRSSEITVSKNGQVNLAASNIPIESGDVTARQVTAQTATLSASYNLTLIESQLTTTGNLTLLAQNTVRVRDSITSPFAAHARGNLYIQGGQGIDILALNHPDTPFQSGGDLTLVSDGVVSGDSHFASGGRFSILKLTGQPGTFVSLYDPIISSTGDVTFGDYTGVALKVETFGSINAGNITITGPDTSLSGSDPDISTLNSSRALILRAGLTSLSNPANVPQNQQGTSFTSSGSTSSPGSIVTKAVRTLAGNTEKVNGGSVVLSAPGGIQADSIDSSSSLRNGGSVSLSSNSGAINVGSVDSSSQSGNGGTIAVSNNSGNTTTGSLDSSSQSGNGGTIAVSANSGNISTGSADSSAQSGNGGTISIESNSGRTNVGSLDSSSQSGNGGTIAISSNSGSVNSGSVDSSSQSGNGGTIALNSNSGSVTTGSIDSSSQSGNKGTVVFSSNSGIVSTGSSSTNASVISTNTQNSTTDQQTKDISSIPSNIPYNNLPEISRKTEVTAESIELAREKEFEDVLGKNFPEKFTNAKDIRFALHSLENQFEERRRKAPGQAGNVPGRPAIVYAVFRKSGQLELVVETSDGEFHPRTPLEATKLNIKNELAILQENLEIPINSENERNKLTESTQKLYKFLIQPLENTQNLKLCPKNKSSEDIDCVGTLLFSLDPGLRFIPIVALQDSNKEILTEKYNVNISLIPDLNYTDITYSDIPKYKEYQVLTMGSDFSDSNFNLGILAGVPAELENIQKIWGGKNKNILLNESFNPKELRDRSNLQPFRIIHIATHSGFEQNDSKFYIYFPKDKRVLADLLRNQKENQQTSPFLGWHDFRVDLLVLSACKTLPGITGEIEREKIFVGLPAQVGVKSAIASLWNINDLGSLIFMNEFYQNLHLGMSKAEALKQAQLIMKHGIGKDKLSELEKSFRELLEDEKEKLKPEVKERLLLILGFLAEEKIITEEMKQPYYWATFTLVGNPW